MDSSAAQQSRLDTSVWAHFSSFHLEHYELVTRLGPAVDSGVGRVTSQPLDSGSCVRMTPRGPEVTALVRQWLVHIRQLQCMVMWPAPGQELCSAMLATPVRSLVMMATLWRGVTRPPVVTRDSGNTKVLLPPAKVSSIHHLSFCVLLTLSNLFLLDHHQSMSCFLNPRQM